MIKIATYFLVIFLIESTPFLKYFSRNEHIVHHFIDQQTGNMDSIHGVDFKGRTTPVLGSGCGHFA